MPRKLRALKAGTVATLTLIGCLSCTAPPETTAPPEITAPSVPHADAAPFVQQRDEALGSARATLRLLIPVGNCVFGIADGPGRVSNWVGEQGCTSLVPSPASTLAVTDAVPMDDGSIIGVGESLFRRDPDGSVHRLAALPRQAQFSVNSPPVPFALAKSGQRLIVVGRFRVYDQRWGDVYLPTAWESTDAGVTVHQISLPFPPVQDPLHIQEALGLGALVEPMRIAADGDTVLATDGYGYGSRAGLRLWRSVDGGHTWSVVSVPLDRAQSGGEIFALLRAGGRWLLIIQGAPFVDSSPRGDEPARLVFSSADGAAWTIEQGLDLGRGWVVAGTHDRGERLVLIGYDSEILPAGCISNSTERYKCQLTRCEVVWTGPIGNIVRRNLRCGITGGEPTAVATLADGRALIADNVGNLWIRR